MIDKHYYMPFNVGDWLKDPAVSSCSAATRGVWFDLLCRLHAGRLKGIRATLAQMTRLCRCSELEALTAIQEIAINGVAIVTFDDEHFRFDFKRTTNRCATPEWMKLRLVVLKRDARRCRYCGENATHVDHVVPHSRGGGDSLDNLVAACRSCNLRKHARTPLEAGMVIDGR